MARKRKGLIQVKKSVAVVGGGLAGLAAALRLAKAGLRVELFEAQAELGGRAQRLQQGGFSFDLGPSLLMMPEIVEELFALAGGDRAASLPWVRLEEGSSFRFPGGQAVQMARDPLRRAEAIAQVDPAGAKALEPLLQDLRGLQAAGMAGFIRPRRMKLGGLLRPQQLGYFLRGMVAGSFQDLLRRRLGDGPLAEALGFLALYLGMDPRHTPAVFSVLLEAELVGGLHYPLGGMHALPRALQRLAEGLGVRVHTGARVVGLPRAGRRVEGLQLEGEAQPRPFEGVVLALDRVQAQVGLLQEPLRRRLRSGHSAWVWHLGLEGPLPGLGHHTVMLPPRMAPFLDALAQGRLSEAPAWYLCQPSATDPSLAPAGCSQLYVLVPVPHLQGGLDWGEASPWLQALLWPRLEALGLSRRRVLTEAVMGPAEMQAAWGLHEGAAFGLAHGWGQLGPFRPSQQHPHWRNLCFAGASTHPGNGIPLVLLSGQQAAEALLEALGP